MENSNRSRDFNIYYLNVGKVYEIAMIINNVVVTKIERDNTTGVTEDVSLSSSVAAEGANTLLTGIKASIGSEIKESSYSSQKVVESLDVKTTKSILLRSILEKCSPVRGFKNANEGDLVKIDGVKLELFDEESLRQFLVLRRDALKGMRVEGMEVNNLIASMLQDYAYVLKGTIQSEAESTIEILIKIPMDVKPEFESQYSIDDLLIGHVSIVGIYKGLVSKGFVSSSTFSYWRDAESRKNDSVETSKIIKSNTQPERPLDDSPNAELQYHFIDTLAIIQDVAFYYEKPIKKKLHWWNRIGIWLTKLGRK